MEQITVEELKDAQTLLREHVMRTFGTTGLTDEQSFQNFANLITELFARMKRLEDRVDKQQRHL